MVLSQAEQLKFIEDIKQGKIKVIDPTRGGVLANYSMYKLPNEEGTTNSAPTNSAPTTTQTSAPPINSAPTTTQTTAPPINSAPPPSAPTNSSPIESETTYTYTYPNQTGYTDSYRSRNLGNSSKYTLISQQYDPSIENSGSNSYYLYIIGSLVISYFLFNQK